MRHRWNLSPKQAIALQKRLCDLVDRRSSLGRVRRVAGVDVGFENARTARAAVAVLSYPGWQLEDSAVVRRPVAFPYVPGLLSFREIPAVLQALRRLQQPPDLILCDGQGIAHPRRLGIASHLGILTGLPTIGVAKSRLIGEHGALPYERGAWVPLVDKGEIIGAVVRMQDGVSPLYVSIGHRINLPTAVRWVLRAASRYRLPETTRHAHRLASGG